ncbi:MAG: DUF2288 domain-containing protein [Granulosicoccus sp.]
MAISASINSGEGDPLNLETGVIPWSDLAKHFARGVVIHVSTSVDLVVAAKCLAADDTATLQGWLEDNHVRRAEDNDARDWAAREPEFWCVVVAPWVLVQERVG